jgi:hypothetical protein
LAKASFVIDEMGVTKLTRVSPNTANTEFLRLFRIESFIISPREKAVYWSEAFDLINNFIICGK